MVSGFSNRQHAGHELAKALKQYSGREDVIVLGLPRGGVPVAAVIARELNAPLDIFVVRKLGVPGHEELAMGAIASNDARVLNFDMIEKLDIRPDIIASVAEEEAHELRRRERTYRGDKPYPTLEGKTVILVDDGLATGATMKAAIQGMKQHDPEKIVVALPVGSERGCEDIAPTVDELICLLMPPNFGSVSIWYSQFEQTTDNEVRMLLQEASRRAIRT